MKFNTLINTGLALLTGILLLGCTQKEQDPGARAVAAAETYLVFEATGAEAQTINVYADGLWQVDVDSDWISVTPLSGTGHGEITISVTDNATGNIIDRPRDGKITLQGRTVERNSTVVVHQDGDTYYGVQTYTLSEIAALEDGEVAKVAEARVMALTKKGFVLIDDSGSLYATGTDVELGDIISFNGAKATLYGGAGFNTDEIDIDSHSEVTYPEAPDMTSQIGAYEGGVLYLKLKGSLVNGVLKVGKANVQLVDPVDELKLDEVDLHKVTVTGYAVGLAGSTGYMVATEVEDEGADETLVPYPLRWAMGKDLNYSNSTFNNDNPRIDPIQGIGYIEYVPSDLESTNSAGNYKLDVSGNNPRVTGPWVNDYWLFYGNGAIPANTEVQIAFEMRSSKWGQKYWVLEYLDGEEWKTAPNVKYSDEPGYETPYHAATNEDGATNQPVMEVIKFRKNNEHLQIRLRCSANWRGGGQPMANPRTTASSRLSVTNVDDDTYKPNIIILKEGNGVEKDPVYANIEVSTDLLTFNGVPGDPKVLTITSDYDFTVSTSASWLSLDVTEGLAGEPTEILVTCEESELPDLRQGTIKIISEDSEKVVNVVQSAAGQVLDPFISITTGNHKEVLEIDGALDVCVQSNVEVSAEAVDDWLGVTEAGTKVQVEWTNFVVTYAANESPDPRTGTVRFFNEEKNLETVLTVVQAGKEPEPEYPEGVYFQDDFEWLAPWSGSSPDDVTDNSVGSAPNMFTTEALAPALAELQKRGYGYVWGWDGQDWSDGTPDEGSKQTLYLMKNYLKFGKTSCNSGIILPALTYIEGTADVDLTFDWCWCMTGKSKPDLMTLTLTLTGGGTFADTGAEVSGEITSAQPTKDDQTKLEWQHATVKILGATPSTRITIRPTYANPKISNSRDQNRWYLDNIKVAEPEPVVVFQDDFSWFKDIADAAGAGDGVGNQESGATAPNVYTFDETGSAAFLQLFNDMGYEDLNPSGKVLYMQKYYLKFSKNKVLGGIRLPKMSLGSAPSNAVLEFDWCAQMGGSGSVDNVSLNVELTGAGTCADSGAAKSNDIAHTQETGQMFWQHVIISLKDVTDDTRIEIKPSNFGATSGYYRWFLDNIKVTQ